MRIIEIVSIVQSSRSLLFTYCSHYTLTKLYLIHLRTYRTNFQTENEFRTYFLHLVARTKTNTIFKNYFTIYS